MKYVQRPEEIEAIQIQESATQAGPPSSRVYVYKGVEFQSTTSVPVVGDYLLLMTEKHGVHMSEAAFVKRFAPANG